MKILSTLFLGSLMLLGGCQPREAGRTAPEPQPEQQTETPAEQVEETPAPAPLPSPTGSMVGINATNQGYAMIQPWSKENPAYSQGFGIYLGDGNILTAANIVYSASFVEVTSADGSQTVPVTVTAFDPEANLALLRLKNGKDAAFLDKLVPVALGKAPRLGDKVTFWQFNGDGLPITTSGTLLATESACPFTNGEPFVLYNVKSSVTPLKGGAGNPVMRGNELVGLSASCDPSAQKVLAVTHTMISRFLEQARAGNYTGFPADGTQVTELTDPVFRKFLGLPETGGGFYVVKLPVYGSFYKAGVRPGDVVESVTGDKKAEQFEDSYLDSLFQVLEQAGVGYITYMPSRNTDQQIQRLRALCLRHGMGEISGEDVNSPSQSFICQKLAEPGFSHLVDAAWALVRREARD